MSLLIYLFLLLLGVFLPVRFHLHFHRRGRDEFFLAEMIFLGLYVWQYKLPDLETLPPGGGRRREIETEKGPGLEEKEKLKTDDLDSLLTKFNRIRSALGKYGFGGTLFYLFLPPKYGRWIGVAQRLEDKGRFLRFTWSTTLGYEDPALTGIALGLAWAVKGTALGLIQRGYKFIREPRIMVNPGFTGSLRETFLDCIFEIKLGHIILAGLKKIITEKMEGEERDARTPD